MKSGDLLVLKRTVLGYPDGYIFILVSCDLGRCTVVDNMGRIVYFWEERMWHVLPR
jgi:hypothetical protein